MTDLFSLAFSVSPLGPKRYQLLINKFGDPKKAWEGDRSKYYELSIKDKTFEKFNEFRKNFVIEDYVSKLNKENVTFISFLDKEYPKSLRALDNPPIGLFCKGNIGLLNHSKQLKIGVVGTRKITQYGKTITEKIVGDLVENQAIIVSGLALGVDAIAHLTTIQNKGLTIAVLGCGVDCCLPSENYCLYRDIIKQNGLIISEYPLSLPPNKGTFPARNRIIASLSDGVLVTEAAEDSGSLITADYALQFGKKIFSVPGPVTSKMSEGSLKLLKQGASLVTEAQDILNKFEKVNSKKKKAKKINFSENEMKIIELLESEEMTVDEISKKLKINPINLSISISNLELQRIVKNNGGKLLLA